MVQFFVNEKLRVGYSFDYSLTPLANYNYGSHEISIGLFLQGRKIKINKSKMLLLKSRITNNRSNINKNLAGK